MTDLDTAVRAMLRERAGDIDSLPADFADLNSLDVLDVGPLHELAHRRRTAWLIAAAVAVVLTVVGAAVAIRSGGPTRTPAATHSPTSPPTATPTISPRPATGHLPRQVSLAWFGMKKLPGYAERARSSEPGYRQLAVRRSGDTAVPIGCNGCEMASAYIDVFDKGRFDPRKASVENWQQVTIGGKAGYLGTMKWFSIGKYDLPTVAWQFQPGRWALVQAVTPDAGTRAALLTVATAVQPTVSVPIELPFTFGYLPTLPVIQVVDDRSEGYAFGMTFGSPDSVSFDITLWNSTQVGGRYDTAGTQLRTIGGLPGRYSFDHGAAVVYHDGLAVFGEADNGEGQSDPARTAFQREQMEYVLAGVRWTNGDGRAPYVPAEKAIP
jgi:hypothetical protein